MAADAALGGCGGPRQAAKDSATVALNSTPGGGMTLFLLFAAGMAIAIRETLTYLPFKLF